MKIECADLKMTGTHLSIESKEKSESLTFWTGNKEDNIHDTLDLSLQGKNMLLATIKNSSRISSQYKEMEISDEDKLKVKLLEKFIEALTGKKIKIQLPKIKLQQSGNPQAGQMTGQIRQGWGLIYDYQETHYEKETMSFTAQGIIKTGDGREIYVNLELNMSREFLEHTAIHIRAGDAKAIDPLVINYAGTPPELSNTTFVFDLDADGREEQISCLQQNSGFLSLDLNNDGVINDGSELFGPQSGDGFSDLSHYDDDKNGWIDENDHIFHKLRIWTKDENGSDYLLALGEVGIGAICLSSVSTLFSMKGEENNLLGEIQKSGLFLREDGTSGTVQHIDMAV